MNRRSFIKATLLAVVAAYAPISLKREEYIEIDGALGDGVTPITLSPLPADVHTFLEGMKEEMRKITGDFHEQTDRDLMRG